jgi:hypothetical protein
VTPAQSPAFAQVIVHVLSVVSHEVQSTGQPSVTQ